MKIKTVLYPIIAAAVLILSSCNIFVKKNLSEFSSFGNNNYGIFGFSKDYLVADAWFIEISPDGKHMYYGDEMSGNIFLTNINKNNTLQTFTAQVPGQKVLISPSGKYVYTINGLSLIAYKRNISNGSLTQIDIELNFTTNTIWYFTISPDEKNIYVTTNSNDEVYIFRLDQDNGHINSFWNVSLTGMQPRRIAVSPDGKNVYVSGINLNYFDREPNTGALLNQRSIARASTSIAISNYGDFLYAGSDVYYYKRNLTTGELTDEQFMNSTTQYTNLKLSNNNKYLYKTSFSNSNPAISYFEVFELDNNGKIKKSIYNKNIPTISGDRSGFAVSCDDKSVYLLDYNLDIIKQYVWVE